MIRIEEIKLGIDHKEQELQKMIVSILQLPSNKIHSFNITKKAIDSRFNPVRFIYSVDVALHEDENIFLKSLFQTKNADLQKNVKKYRIHKVEPFHYQTQPISVILEKPLVVVGAGPCGLFAALSLAKAGLKPIVIERGKEIRQRIVDVEAFFKNGILNPESNIQFGEGGAGTFSDGKLTTLVNNERIGFIAKTLVDCGAPSEILYDAKPHIGTDKLQIVVKNLREKIISLGGTFRFDSKLTGLNIKNNAVHSVFVNETEEMQLSALVLAIGHSARDTFQMLYDNNILIQQKPFSVGLRIEHPASYINKIQYGSSYKHPLLPPAKYKLSKHLPNGCGVYTFCMCPGGVIVPAASEENMLVVNGMSRYKQDGENSNSAVLVNITPENFGSNHPLAGIDFQRQIEKKAFEIGGGNYFAPTQLLSDFLNDCPSKAFVSVTPSYKPGVTFAELKYCLPEFVVKSLKLGIVEFNKMMKGFALDSAVLTAPETRSSAPVRIVRDDDGRASVKNIFPSGEGAGYAGGIISSALDGLLVTEKIINLINNHSL